MNGAFGFESSASLGLSLRDESCRLEVDESTRARGLSIFRLICAENQVGLVVPHSLENIREIEQRFTCGNPVRLDDQGVLSRFEVQPCRRRDNQEPFAVMRFEALSREWVAEGPPSIIPNIMALSNLPLLSSEDREKLVGRLPILWGGPVPLLSSAQIKKIRTLLRDARLANQSGSYETAENLNRELLALQSEVNGPKSVSVGETLLDLALNVSNQGRFSEAFTLFERAELLIAEPSAITLRARLRSYRCLDAANRGDFSSALAYAADAVKTWQSLITDKNALAIEAKRLGGMNQAESVIRTELTYAIHLESAMLLRNQQAQSAYQRAGEALRVSESVSDFPPEWRAEILMTLGEAVMSVGRIGAAEQFFRAAYEIRMRTFGPSEQSIQALFTLGRSFHAEGIDSSAIATYREAFGLLLSDAGQQLGYLSSEELVDFVGSANAVILRQDTAASQRLQLLEEIFFAAQLTRSGVVSKTLERSAQALGEANPLLGQRLRALFDLERELKSLRSDLSDLAIRPAEDRDARQEGRLLERIRLLERDIQAQRKGFEKDFPSFKERFAPKPLTIGQLQLALTPDEAYLFYVFGRRVSYAMLVTSKGAHLSRIPLGESSIAKLVDQLRKSTKPDSGGGLGAFDFDAAIDLYSLLLKPFETHLQGLSRLHVNTSGPVANLPHGILLMEPVNAAGDPSFAMPWAVKRFAFSYVPSLQAFLAQRARPESTDMRKPFLGLGNPALKGTSGPSLGALAKLAEHCSPGQPFPGKLLLALAALPDTEVELRKVSELVAPGGKPPLLLREQANEDALRKLDLDQYRVLYFATHALLPGELRCQTEPALVLSPPSKQAVSKSYDGLLQASEIASLRLNADLVVLSACNTAAGSSSQNGEALSGLAEAFFYAGARSLLVTHWQVPSAETSQLMTTLFTRLTSKGGRLGDSLQEAQKLMLKSPATAHPYFWGAFTLVGDGSRVIQTSF